MGEKEQKECHLKADKNCDEKQEKHCKHKEFEEKIEALTKELDTAKKTIDEQKTTISNYLATASYYKNEVDNQKKDFDRYKERNKNILDEAKVQANEKIAKMLLPIIDNFDQAISKVEPEVMKGFAMIYGSLMNVISELGIAEIKTAGEKLNPEFHNCISTEETDDETKDDEIANVYQKGYVFTETNKVIRPATVSVYKLNK